MIDVIKKLIGLQGVYARLALCGVPGKEPILGGEEDTIWCPDRMRRSFPIDEGYDVACHVLDRCVYEWCGLAVECDNIIHIVSLRSCVCYELKTVRIPSYWQRLNTI